MSHSMRINAKGIGNRLRNGALVTLAFTGLGYAAEMRTWTNLKGQTIQAELLSVDGDRVRLRMEGGRDVTIERDTLSAGDQQYLAEYGGGGEVVIDDSARVDMPEKKMRFDSKTLIRRDDKFFLPEGFSLEFDIVESEHFLVMSSGRVRGKDIAELAERMWAGMNFQHPGFADKWGDEKRAIFLCGEDEDYEILGRYQIHVLQSEAAEAPGEMAQQLQIRAQNTAATWPQTSGAGLRLDAETADKYKVASGARAFKASNKRTFKSGVWNPFPTHCIAGDVLGQMMGGAGFQSDAREAGGTGGDGGFALRIGHAYFKEIQLTGETVTQMIDANTYESDEIVKAGGFDDGTKWARTLRDLVKKDKVEADIEALYRVSDASGLTPELTVLAYGWAAYMQSTPSRLDKFSDFLNRIDTGRTIPVPQEMAKIFGFETVEEFEADWKEYLTSTSFK